MSSESRLGTTTINQIIDQIDYGINVVDSDFNFLFINDASRKILNLTSHEFPRYKCFELLFNRKEPCNNCPILEMDKTGESFGQIIGELNTHNHPNHRVKYHRLSEGLFVQTLRDITRETELVRQVSLQSKETQAQNIILKRKRQEVETHSQFLNTVFNSIHAGILVLDSSYNLKINTFNNSIKNFVGESSETDLQKRQCFELFGYHKSCPGCPIEFVTSKTNYTSLRYHQKINNYTLTEFYVPLPDGKVLLIFEDSTKRVGMLQQLKEHKAIIEWQNQIFRSLLETSTLIQKATSLEETFTCALQQLNTLFENLNFGIILDGERPEILEAAVFQGISPEEERLIVSKNKLLLDNNINQILLEEIHKDQSFLGESETKELKEVWIVIPMRGRERRIIGKLIIHGIHPDQQSIEIITLFLEQIAAVAENKQLTHKLEKLANTDPLTGVYNRGYFGRELEHAIENAMKYDNICFSIIVIDVNGLKRVNDVFGHERGDEMIIRVAKLLSHVCRKSDIVTRLGGDEFVILCPSTNYEQGGILLSRIREKENESQLECKHEDGKIEMVQIRMSIGLASSVDIEPENVLKTADHRMYADKEAFYANRERYR